LLIIRILIVLSSLSPDHLLLHDRIALQHLSDLHLNEAKVHHQVGLCDSNIAKKLRGIILVALQKVEESFNPRLDAVDSFYGLLILKLKLFSSQLCFAQSLLQVFELFSLVVWDDDAFSLVLLQLKSHFVNLEVKRLNLVALTVDKLEHLEILLFRLNELGDQLLDVCYASGRFDLAQRFFKGINVLQLVALIFLLVGGLDHFGLPKTFLLNIDLVKSNEILLFLIRNFINLSKLSIFLHQQIRASLLLIKLRLLSFSLLRQSEELFLSSVSLFIRRVSNLNDVSHLFTLVM